MHSFKQVDLLPYLYGEISIEEANTFKIALEKDGELREQYQQLADAKKALETISLSPRKKAIEFIMNYANTPVKAVVTSKG